MCDLLGLCYNIPVNSRISLDVFQKRGTRNPDGWGLAFYRNGNLQVIKEAESSAESRLYDFVELYQSSSLLVSHVRRSTKGVRSYLNTHPFYRMVRVGEECREWTFAHNGTLEDYMELELSYLTPLGTTDSEHVFCYILESIIDRGIDSWETKDFRSLEVLLSDINDSEKRTLNCVMSDGEYLFCYSDRSRHNGGLRHTEQRYPFKSLSLEEGGEKLGVVDIESGNISREEYEHGSGFIVVTRPLTSERWQEFSPGSLRVYKGGKVVYDGQE